MRSLLLLLCFSSLLLCGEDYGKKLEIKRIPGVEEGAMSAALEKNMLWVAGSKGTLFGFNVSKPDEPELVSKIKVLRSCRQMALRNGIAAVTGRQHGMALVDLRIPKKPQLLSRYQSIELATGIDLAERFAYISNRIYGVETVDISDLRKPRFAGNILTEEAQSVKVSGNLVFAGNWAAGRIQIFDASNPAVLKNTGRIQLDGLGDGLDAAGDLVFASTGHHKLTGPKKERIGNGHALEIWNIKDPRHPEKLSRFKFPRFYTLGNDFWTVRVSGKYAFCADTHNGFFVLNIERPEKPFCIGHARLQEVPVPRAYDADGKLIRNSRRADAASGVAVGNGVVYVTGLKTGLYAVKLPGIAVPQKAEKIPDQEAAVPALPEVKGFVSYRPEGMVREAAVSGDIAFLAASEGGICSVRLGENSITPLRNYPEHFAFDVKVRKNILYAAEREHGLGVYEICENGVLKRKGKVLMPGGIECQRIWAPSGSNIVIATDHSGKIFFFDVSDPARAKEVFRYSQVGLVYSDLMTHQLVGGRYLFFNWHNSGYSWFDLSGKKPVLANWKRVRFGSHRSGAASLGEHCLAAAGGGYYFLKPNQSGIPSSEWKLIRLPGKKLYGIPEADGNTVAFSCRRTGEITVIDVTDPQKPRLEEKRSCILPGMTGAVCFFRHRMVIPAGYAGLYLEKMKNER